ncbi:MAG: 4-(cytidine 5'-diphospho)-2-C-methyl-D-erythritol kinase [Parachlamydiaceae bacterium]
MLTLCSPAKVNLFLRVLSRREDGYHDLASLMQTIDLHDTIHFHLASEDSLVCTDAKLPTDHSNLIIKALDLFRHKTGINQPVAIYLEKKIPMEAGLGGGSSNAATTLWAMNELCGRPVMEAQLAQWGGEIGSDVAFFLSEGTAYCTGRGEILRTLPRLDPSYLWIIKPPQGLSTGKVYGKFNPLSVAQNDPEQVLQSFLSACPTYFNDLEAPAFEVMPELAKLKALLFESGFSTVLMSGSGSSFFCMGDGVIPHLPGYVSCSAQFINRKSHTWY